MIRSLRRKFVLINMLLVFIVLVAVFSVQCLNHYRQLEQESLHVLEMSLGRRQHEVPLQFEIGKPPPKDYIRSFSFTVVVSEDGTLELWGPEDILVSEEELGLIVTEVLANDDETGILSAYQLRYRMRHDEDHTRIAFVDLSEDALSLRNTVLTALLSVTAALSAFFLISLYLSRWALKPVEKAWTQQRQFIADASHELKTPLTVILANLGILKGDSVAGPEDERHWLENTEQEALRMKGLVDDLLFLAKSDAEEQHLVFGGVHLSDLVFSTSLAFEAVAFERGLSIETEGIEEEIQVSGNAAQLRQLMSILLDNAVKYSEEGGRIDVTLSQTAGKAQLTVRNGGRVLPPEEQQRIFDRFYRSDRARTSEGYGLGLAIAQRIVETHDGSISVSSGPEQGTVFAVAFPLLADS